MCNNGLKIELKIVANQKSRKNLSDLLIRIENRITKVLDDEFKFEVCGDSR